MGDQVPLAMSNQGTNETIVYGFLAMSIVILLQAMISAMKAAFSAVNPAELEKDNHVARKKIKIILEMLKKAEHYINGLDVILISCGFVSGIFYCYFFLGALKEFANWGFMGSKTAEIVIFTAGFLFLLYIDIVLGRILPRKLALRNPFRTVCLYGNIVYFILRIIAPFLYASELLVKWILLLFGIRFEVIADNLTEEEIISMVQEGHEQGVLEASEAEMISNIIEFDEKEANDIMTHRKKIVAVSAELSVEEAVHFMLGENYSRFPLYEENIDDIIGILHFKDVMRYYIGEKKEEKTLKELAREPFFIPDTKSISALFQEMQENNVHMSVAIDEYGQTAGLVAMEDVLEEIVGNIFDEYDIDEKMIIEQANGRFLMRGLADLNDVAETLGIEIEEDDYDTLNGLLISLLDRIPSDKEKPTVCYQGFSFHIVDIKDKTIRYVRVSRLPDKESYIRRMDEIRQEGI